MFVFKRKPYIVESLDISEEEFDKATKKQWPYVVKDSEGKERFYAVCPECDNPIQIIGLYKQEKDSGVRKPYGKHCKKTIRGIAEYDENAYINCSLSNPKYKQQKNIRRKNSDPTANALLNLLAAQYDRIIYILSQSTGIYISYAFAEKLLTSYIANKGWLMYDSSYSNLPYMLLYYDAAHSLVGRSVKVDSEIHKAIEENCPDIEFVDSYIPGYSKVSVEHGKYANLMFRIANHKYKEEEHNVIETFQLKLEYHGEDIYNGTITVFRTWLQNLINMPAEKSHRNQRLLEIAKNIILE